MENNEMTTEQLQQETDAVKAVREEMMAQLEELKQNYEATINTMRSEHIKQVRDILRNGTSNTETAAADEEDDITEDGFSKKAIAAQIDRINKQLKL
jgi:hypothetical protein